MIILHHCISARSFRPLWMLEELGLPYRLRVLPFPPRVHARPFLQENPLGTVPLLEDGATRMTLRNRGEPSGLARVGAGLMVRQMRKANQTDLAALKAILER